MVRALLLTGRLFTAGALVFGLALSTAVAASRKPEDVLKGRIILSEKPYPPSFRSDTEFIAHMKRVDTKGFKYAGREKIPLEMMAFFADPINVTQLQATVYDVTERLEMKDNFPIYPGQRGGRVLATFFELRKDTFEPQRRYKVVISSGYRGVVLAESDFAIVKD